MPTTVAFAGSQTVANVEEACARLRSGIADAAEVEIDLSAVTEADLAFVQLLLAARRSLVAQRARLSWRGASAAVAQVIARAGLASANLLDPIEGEQE